MKASTIRLDLAILEELEKVIPPSLSLRKYLHDLIIRDIHARKMEAAAVAYAQFLKMNREEEKWLERWESAAVDEPMEGLSTKCLEEW